jgi:hypothetical protein
MPEERFIAVTFPSVYRAMRDLISDSLKIVKEEYGDPPQWPQDQFREVTFSPPGGTGLSIVLRPYPARGLSTAWGKAKSLPSFEATEAELKKLEVEGKAVGHWMGELTGAYAFPVLEKYVQAGLPLSFQEDGFARCYGEIESSSTGSVRLFLELFGLKSELSTVQLDANHRIFRVDEETARRLWIRTHHAKLPVSYFSFFHDFPGVVQAHHMLLPESLVMEVTFRFPKERSGEMSLLLSSKMKSASTALRLSYPGGGVVRFHTYEYAGFFPETGIFGFTEDLTPRTFSYVLDETASTILKRRWPSTLDVAEKLESASGEVSSYLRVAIQRLNSSVDKKYPADQFLDHMIALEALVSRERDAVSYRVALRIATIIGQSASDRQSVLEVVSNAYDERSHLSHGRPSKLTSAEPATTSAYLSKIEDVLARTINFFIAAEIKGKKKEEILKLIDETIASQDRTKLEGTLSSSY